MKISININRKYQKQLKNILAKHISSKIFKAHKFRGDKDLVMKPQDTGRVVKELTNSMIDFFRYNINKNDFYYVNMHYDTDDEWQSIVKYKKLPKDKLQKLCIDLGLINYEGGDIDQMAWLIAGREIYLKQMIKNNQEELRKFDEI